MIYAYKMQDIASCKTLCEVCTKGIRRAQWLSGRVLDSRPRGGGLEPHLGHCLVSLSKNINPSLVLVQPRKTRPFIAERLLMGCKESIQTNKQTKGIGNNFIQHTALEISVLTVYDVMHMFEMAM